MDTSTTRVAEPRDQHIADLRAAVQRAVPLLAFSAGREADTDPTYAEMLLTAARELENVLTRTAP